MVIMNILSIQERVAVIRALVEGNSMRATGRLTGVAKNTVAKLLVDIGTACAEYHDDHVRGVKTERVQCDEIWSFCYCKQKNVPEEMKGEFGYGDVWTWTGIDADHKLCISYFVGLRDGDFCNAFVEDLAGRLANRVQLTSDAWKPYQAAIDAVFQGDIDYAILHKTYGNETPGVARYSPAKVTGTTTQTINGNPKTAHISTSYVERQNLTMRMSMRRFTRLTNAFSKKVENLMHAVALHFMYYNFCRVHQTLRVTPAMSAGLADHVWEIEELVALLDAQ